MLHTIRGLLIACTAAAVLLSTPAESLACGCGFFKRLFGCGCGHADPCADPCATGRTTYRPLFGWLGFGRRDACCNPCTPACAPQTCQYVPTTCYRTECVNVPVTACRPVTTCDPCTGCPTTVMRPYTTYARQVRRVPYTTYRVAPAPASGCCGVGHAGYAAPMGGCSACGTTAGYAPAPTGYSMQPLPGVTHDHAADAGMQYAPTYQAAPAQSGTIIQSGPAISTPAPAASGEFEVDSTYEGDSSPSGATLQRPIPDINVGGSNNRVQPSDAHTGDRTTSMPIHRGGGTWSAQERPASAVIPAKLVRPSKTTIDDGGWTAASR